MDLNFKFNIEPSKVDLGKLYKGMKSFNGIKIPKYSPNNINNSDNQNINVEEMDFSCYSSNDKVQSSSDLLNEPENFRVLGLQDRDIDRVISGKISIYDLIREIQNDPERLTALTEASFLAMYNQNLIDQGANPIQATSLSDLQSIINDKQSELNSLMEERRSLEAGRQETQAVLDFVSKLQSGTTFENAMQSVIAWQYVDSTGQVHYVENNGAYGTANKPIGQYDYKPVTFGDLYGNSSLIKELKDTLTLSTSKSFFTGKETSSLKWDYTENQNQFLAKLLAQKNDTSQNNSERLDALNASIEKLQGEYSQYEYIKQLIADKVQHEINNIAPYINKDDFNSKNYFNEDSLKAIDKIVSSRKGEDFKTDGEKSLVLYLSESETVDVLNCLINGKGKIEGNRVSIDGSSYTMSSQAGSIFRQYLDYVPHMQDNERAIFNYIYNSDGKEKALEYLKQIAKEMDTRWLAAKTQEDQEYANKHPILTSVASIATVPIDGISAACLSLSAKLNGEEIRRSDVYSAGNIWRAQVSEDILNYWSQSGHDKTGNTLSFLYNTGMSMADSASLIAVNALTGGVAAPVLSATIMGSRSYVSTLNDALDRGMSDGSAIALAFSSAVVETAMENYSLGHLTNLEGKLSKETTSLVAKVAGSLPDGKIANVATGLAYIAASSISQGIAEGEEELCTELVNYACDEIISHFSGNQSNREKEIAHYMALGYNEDEAWNLHVGNFVNQLEMSFLGGFVSGNCFGGFSGIQTTHNISSNIASYLKGDYNNLGGLTFADTTTAQMYASAVEQLRQQGVALEQLSETERHEKITSVVDTIKTSLDGIKGQVSNILSGSKTDVSTQNAIQSDATSVSSIQDISKNGYNTNVNVPLPELNTSNNTTVSVVEQAKNLVGSIVAGASNADVGLKQVQAYINTGNSSYINSDLRESISHIPVETLSEVMKSNYNWQVSEANIAETLAAVVDHINNSSDGAVAKANEGVRRLLDFLETQNYSSITSDVDLQTKLLAIPKSDLIEYIQGHYSLNDGVASKVTFKIPTIGSESFNQFSVQERENYLRQASPKQIDSLLLKNPLDESQNVNLSNQELQILRDKVLANQDLFFLGKISLDRYFEIENLIIPKLPLEQLTNNSLVSLLSNKFSNDTNRSILLQELYRRIDSGDIVFDRLQQALLQQASTVEYDATNVFYAMSSEYQSKIVQMLQQHCSKLPENIKAICRGNVDLFTMAYLATNYMNGSIDNQGLDLLSKIHEENPSKLKDINSAMLNAEYIGKLGEDFVRLVINNTSVSSMITSLHDSHPELYQVFVNAIKTAEIDNSLYTLYPKSLDILKFLFDNSVQLEGSNISLLNGDSFINYVLYQQHNGSNSAISLSDFSANYDSDFAKKCDSVFDRRYSENDYNSLKDCKNAYLSKYFSMGYSSAVQFVERYGFSIDKIGKYDSEAVALLEHLKLIVEMEDMNQLKSLYDSALFKIDSEMLLNLDARLRKAYATTYTETLAKTSDKIANAIEENSNVSEVEITYTLDGRDPITKKVKVVDIGTDFSFIIRSTDSSIAASNIDLVGNSYVQSYYYDARPTSHILASSYITQSNLASCPVNNRGVLYAFNNIDESKIALIHNMDMHSMILEFGYKAQENPRFIVADDMPFYTTRVYNELALERDGTKPSYVVINTDFSEQLKQNAYQAAAEWDIPVVVIDKMSVATKQDQIIRQQLDAFKSTGDVNNLKAALDLYEANISGYKLNIGDAVLQNNNNVSVSNNDMIVNAGLFDSQQFNQTIKQYIQELANKQFNSDKVDELIGLLEGVKLKYDLTNNTNVSVVAKTKSNLDLDELIDLASKIRK